MGFPALCPGVPETKKKKKKKKKKKGNETDVLLKLSLILVHRMVMSVTVNTTLMESIVTNVYLSLTTACGRWAPFDAANECEGQVMVYSKK